MEQVHRSRQYGQSLLWQFLSGHVYDFLQSMRALDQPRYGFLDPIISEVVNKLLECDDLARGFTCVSGEQSNQS